MSYTVGRFAPTPSGELHIGNAFAFLLAWLSAKKQGGEIILRMEDLDTQRCSPKLAEQVMEDLRWLGLCWDRGGTPEFQQARRTAIYDDFFHRLCQQGLVYPCFCSRADLKAASAPHFSDGRTVYSGACAKLTTDQIREKMARKRPAWRLRVSEETVVVNDGVQGVYTEFLPTDCGDFILRRADGMYAYQLAVVVDDALMGVNEVVRARDLLSSAPRQLLLYRQLGFEPPSYYHVPMVLGSGGKRLAKRDGSISLRCLRQSGYTPEEVLGRLGYLAGLQDTPEPRTTAELLERFAWERVPKQDVCIPERLFRR